MSDAWCDDCGEQWHDLFYVRVGEHMRRLCELCANIAAMMFEPELDDWAEEDEYDRD